MLYDLIIIGAGPAGYTVAIYATRYGLKTLVIGQVPGGMAATAHKVDNYPGFSSISGLELMEKFADQTKSLGAEIKTDLIKSIKKIPLGFELISDNQTYQAKTLILALGTQRKKMNIPGEKEFLGKGVSYCATCDAPFFRNKTVAVIGGGDAALQASLQLAEMAQQVYLIFREATPKAMPYWLEQAKKLGDKIVMIPGNSITAIQGDQLVKSIGLQNPYQEQKQLAVEGVFIEIGAVPNSALIKDLGLKNNERGYIEVNTEQQTNIPGIFAAGDVTTGSAGFSQIITAASEGAIAAWSAYRYLK